jgi:hypothetical protein
MNGGAYLRHVSKDTPGYVGALSFIRCPGCGQFIAVSRDDDHPEPYSECGAPDDGICPEYGYAIDRDAEEWAALFDPFPGRLQPPPSDALCAAIEAAHTLARVEFAQGYPSN